MTIKLRQSTASQEIPLGYFVDSTDGNTEETALTIANTDIKLWKMGATTLANKNSGGATHISNGVYYCTLDATDTNTLGALVVFVHVAGALSVRVECEVLDAVVYDSLIAASDKLQVDTVQVGGTTQTARDIGASVLLSSGTGAGQLDFTSGVVKANLAQILGTALTETAGQIAAAFKQFFDVASPTGTMKAITNVVTATNLTNAPTAGDLTATMKASVNAEVVDALNVDTYAEPTGAPPATASLVRKIGQIYMTLRNKLTITATSKAFFNDGGASVWTKALSDNGTTYTEDEGV